MSQDSPEEARAFAEKYEISFPLLADRDRSVSRAYTGVDGADNTIPGIVVIRRDGAIAFRQIAREKDDRLDSAQLLAITDRTLGTSGRAARGGFPALSRLQLGVETSFAFDADIRAFGLSARMALPLARHVVAGLRAGVDTHHTFDTAAFAGLRLPFLGDTAAIELAAFGGLARTTLNAGGQLGLWFAWTPSVAFHLDAGATTERQVVITLGVSRLISWR